MTTFPAPRQRHREVDLDDLFVRGELSVTAHGLRALEHHDAARMAPTRGLRRHHLKAAQRMARRAVADGAPGAAASR